MTPDGTVSTATDADVLRSGEFVRIVTRADGDAIAAAGLLARALARDGTPFQITTGATIGDRTARLQEEIEGVTVSIGPHDHSETDPGTTAETHLSIAATDRPATLAVADHLKTLEATGDPLLTLAGTVAAGIDPGAGETEWLLERALAGDAPLIERRPGVGVPTTDMVDGLAHTGACLAPWSGDEDAVAALLEAVPAAPTDGDVDHRTIGSLVALEAVGDPAASEHAATAIGRFLHPYAITGADGSVPFVTLEGYADVLRATADCEPGTGVALAMGHDVSTSALDAWRACGRRAHTAIEGASTGRYDGLFVVGIDDGPVRTVARLVSAYRSPEPTTLVIGNDEAAIRTRGDRSLGSTLEAVARDLGIETAYDVGRRGGHIRLPGPDDEVDTCSDERIITSVRDHL